jgi:hypothetical protein
MVKLLLSHGHPWRLDDLRVPPWPRKHGNDVKWLDQTWENEQVLELPLDIESERFWTVKCSAFTSLHQNLRGTHTHLRWSASHGFKLYWESYIHVEKHPWATGCLYGLNGCNPNWQFGPEAISPQNFEESGPFPAATGDDYGYYRSRL